METEILLAGGELDFSLMALFWRATLTVKLVMLVLLIASFWSWAIIFQKFLVFNLEYQAMQRFRRAFWSATDLAGLYNQLTARKPTTPEHVFVKAMDEWQQSIRPNDGSIIGGMGERVERVMNTLITRESERLTLGLGQLATIGATAPFIGLFGTVWGIKNAFEEIAIAQNTNLAVVAPGIAEALLATGLGLLAAIPAVIFYNKFTNDSARIIGELENFSDEFLTILSRETEK